MSGKAPKSHASTATTYGVGTTSTYGHCMTINNLTTSTHANGKALSAYQGYVLNNKITPLNTYTTLTYTDVITIKSGFTVTSSSCWKLGNYVHIALEFSGTATSDAAGQIVFASINSAYAKKSSFEGGSVLNTNTSTGQNYTSATLYSQSDNLVVIAPSTSTKYGNSSYGWAGASGIRFGFYIA